ncbi:MAG: MBL fold metallo-hydrolase [Planctomycetota bacterium]
MSLELIVLGSGTSAGVPMIGCDCPVCTSDDPRDNRMRASVLVRWTDDGLPDTEANREAVAFNAEQAGVRQVLIDASPDLRVQAIRERLSRLDGVVYTHMHADHVFGTDDLRRFNAVMGQPIDVFAERQTLDALSDMLPYIFQAKRGPNKKTFIANLIAHELHAGEGFDWFGSRWTPVRLMHGRLPILGFRVDFGGVSGGASGGASLAYCTDVSTVPPESWRLLEGLDVLIIDGLRHRHHPTHMTVERACEVAEQLGAKQTYLTHIAHDLMHAEVDAALPDGVNLAYDGLRIKLDGHHTGAMPNATATAKR